MSTVLGRMLQRSRGELQGIEPLVNSQQTRRALHPQQLEDVAEAALQPRKAAAPPISHTSASAERPSARLPIANPVGEQAGVPPPLPGSQILGKENPSGLISGAASQEGPARASRELTAAALPHASATSLGPESNPEERPPLKLVAVEAQAQKAAPGLRDTARMPAPSGNRSPRPERAEPQPEPQPQQAVETEQRTEIHIAIGSIELRAPSAPQGQAKAQPFRPGVTLEEFLNRKPGASS